MRPQMCGAAIFAAMAGSSCARQPISAAIPATTGARPRRHFGIIARDEILRAPSSPSMMFRWFPCAVISLITACVPLGTQGGWQQQRSAYAQPSTYGSQPQNPYDDDDDYDDDAGGPSYGDANEPDRGQARGGDGGGHSNWTCVAEGSIGTANENGPMLYSNKQWPDNGRTRDEAYLKALKGCNALMGNAANLGYLGGQEVQGGNCTVVDCRPTGT